MQGDPQRRRDQGHVHSWVRTLRCPTPTRACPRGARQARAPRRAGHLPHRDRLARRRGAAGLRARREVGHLHQHQPPGADRPPRGQPAGRGASGLGADPGASRSASASTGTTSTPQRGVRRDGVRDAVAEEHHLGASWTARTPSPIRATPPTSPATRSSSATSSRRSPAAPDRARRLSRRPPSCPTPTTRSC